MGRGRVELKRIENKFNRQVTFSKRRAGLIKKAQEISVLCEADVAVLVVSSKGRLFEYSSDERMEGILQRYERYSNAKKQVQVSASEEHLTLEYAKLKARLEVLQRNKRQLMGEDLDTASLRELQHLEQQLDSALKHIRKKKNRQMNESLSKLQKKEKALQELRDLLDKKVNEEKAMMAQKLPQQVCGGLNNNSSSSSIQPRTLPFSHLGSSSNGSESGEILPAEESQPIGPVLPPWMLRALN